MLTTKSVKCLNSSTRHHKLRSWSWLVHHSLIRSSNFLVCDPSGRLCHFLFDDAPLDFSGAFAAAVCALPLFFVLLGQHHHTMHALIQRLHFVRRVTMRFHVDRRFWHVVRVLWVSDRIILQHLADEFLLIDSTADSDSASGNVLEFFVSQRLFALRVWLLDGLAFQGNLASFSRSLRWINSVV